jgi:hypothetical protein
METPASTFIPKYYLATYIWLSAYVVGFIFLLVFSILTSSLPSGEINWAGIYWGAGFGVAALYEGSKLIKEFKFDDNEMAVHYYVKGGKTIDYREIKGINIQWSYMDTKKAKIYFYEMKNQDDLLAKAVDILRTKNILDINLEEEHKKTFAARNKRLRFALIFTVAIGLVAEFVGNADWSYFSIILILYFILVYQVLRLFIK